MKKLLSILLCLIICSMFGCKANNQNPNGTGSVVSADTITLLDNSFVSQANDIYKNTGNYKDKVIIVQGIYTSNTVNNKEHHYVYRKTKTPEGENTTVGFEFNYSGQMPKANDWIEIFGNVEPSTGADGKESVIINATRVEVMETRGLDDVPN